MNAKIQNHLNEVILRKATAADIPILQDFIFAHGKNSWNFLPEKEVKAHINEISAETVFAFLAENENTYLGFASVYFDVPAHCQKYLASSNDSIAYLGEIVVHRDYQGQGIGSKLINALKEFLIAHHIKSLYTERHSDNPGSAGVMLKTGFKIIDEFYDPTRRPNGSQTTTVLRLDLDETR